MINPSVLAAVAAAAAEAKYPTTVSVREDGLEIRSANRIGADTPAASAAEYNRVVSWDDVASGGEAGLLEAITDNAERIDAFLANN